MSPAQTITTEWKEEKWVAKGVQSKQMPKHKLGKTLSAQAAKTVYGKNAKGNID